MKFRVEPTQVYPELLDDVADCLERKRQISFNSLGVIEVEGTLSVAERTAIKTIILSKLLTSPVDVRDL